MMRLATAAEELELEEEEEEEGGCLPSSSAQDLATSLTLAKLFITSTAPGSSLGICITTFCRWPLPARRRK